MSIQVAFTSLGLARLPQGGNLTATITFPVTVDLTGKTGFVKVRNRDGSSIFTNTAGSSVLANVYSVNIAPTDVSTHDSLTTLEDLQVERSYYRMDILNGDGTLYHRFQGDIDWADPEGQVDV